MSLKSLDEFNAEQTERYERAKALNPNGIACPQCGQECAEAASAVVAFINGAPPRWAIECPSCGWKGSRVCA